ncbi:MAG TPA: 6-phosphogluconolactonase, partial [Hanamia sp.]
IFKVTQPKVNIADNYEDFCKKVTQEILTFSNERIEIQNEFTIVLSGGATPKGVYQCMASDFYRNKFKWEKIHLFWGDERWVLPDDPKSNYRMVCESLLTKVKIPSENIHPIQTKDCDLQGSARLYEKTIGDFFKLKKDCFPHFDLILLGLGQDGHTSSLFPGNPALLVKDRLVVAVSQEGISEQRITLTLPVVNYAHMVFFLVSGHEKAGIVAEVLEDKGSRAFPANKISPGHGKLCWFLDKASASKLPIT